MSDAVCGALNPALAWAYCYRSDATAMTYRMFEALGNYRDACRGMIADKKVDWWYLFALDGMAERLGPWIDANKIEGDSEALEIVREFYDLCMEYADFSKLNRDRHRELIKVFKRAAHFVAKDGNER